MGVMWERVAERRAGIVVMPDGRVFGESVLLKAMRTIRKQIFEQDFRLEGKCALMTKRLLTFGWTYTEDHANP